MARQAIDCHGNLLVADLDNARALRIDTATGAVLNVWNTTNPPLASARNIAGSCVNTAEVLIADRYNARVVRLNNDNNVIATYENNTGCGVAFTSKGEVLIAAAGGYNVAVMAHLTRTVSGEEAVNE